VDRASAQDVPAIKWTCEVKHFVRGVGAAPIPLSVLLFLLAHKSPTKNVLTKAQSNASQCNLISSKVTLFAENFRNSPSAIPHHVYNIRLEGGNG
jgi:hypothetical protein